MSDYYFLIRWNVSHLRHDNKPRKLAHEKGFKDTGSVSETVSGVLNKNKEKK